MAVLYPGTSVSGYNSNPPPDDGSTVSTNLITWAGIKSKIGDPLNTFDTSVDSNITSAFGKTLDGATVVPTGVNYAMTSADQGRLINATASAITITTPDAGTVTAPFIFAVKNSSASTISLAPNATNSQQIDGGTSSLTVQSGGGCFVKTDGTNWFTIAFKPGSNTLTGSNYGFTDPINLNLQASVGSSLLTIAVKTKAGNDPSASDPVQIPFRDTTIANGDPVWVSITSALSINTNAIGASLGTANTVPFRLWIVAFNNAGTVVLGLWQSISGGASPTALAPLTESALQSSTGISAGATSAGTFYTPNGTSLSSKAIRILGYAEYSSGLTTAGTYASAPTVLQLFGPGVKKPGDIVQFAYSTTTTGQTVSTTTKTITALAMTITPSSTPNLILARANASGSAPGASNASTTIFQQMARSSAGTSPSNLIGNVSQCGVSTTGTGNNSGALANEGLDAPGSVSSTPYSVYIWNSAALAAVWLKSVDGTTNLQASMILEEIMV